VLFLFSQRVAASDTEKIKWLFAEASALAEKSTKRFLQDVQLRSDLTKARPKWTVDTLRAIWGSDDPLHKSLCEKSKITCSENGYGYNNSILEPFVPEYDRAAHVLQRPEWASIVFNACTPEQQANVINNAARRYRLEELYYPDSPRSKELLIAYELLSLKQGHWESFIRASIVQEGKLDLFWTEVENEEAVIKSAFLNKLSAEETESLARAGVTSLALCLRNWPVRHYVKAKEPLLSEDQFFGLNDSYKIAWLEKSFSLNRTPVDQIYQVIQQNIEKCKQELSGAKRSLELYALFGGMRLDEIKQCEQLQKLRVEEDNSLPLKVVCKAAITGMLRLLYVTPPHRTQGIAKMANPTGTLQQDIAELWREC
jgi:hypothetical protein